MNILQKIKFLKYKKNPYFQKFYKEIDIKNLENIVFTSFDLETTGLNIKDDEILSIGAIKIKNFKIDLSTKFYRVLKPKKKLEKENVLIHGITQSEIENAPYIDKILPEFLEYIRGTVLIGYFIKFDINMVSKYTKKIYGLPLLNPYIDIRDIYLHRLKSSYKHLHGSEKSLDELAEEFNIPIDERHNAFYDSLAASLVFLALIKKGKVNPLKLLRQDF